MTTVSRLAKVDADMYLLPLDANVTTHLTISNTCAPSPPTNPAHMTLLLFNEFRFWSRDHSFAISTALAPTVALVGPTPQIMR